ncbi:hypothetical protein GQ42DRAFT_65566 [Ramicandelaber brevisporus]|nr:hypothetical protein GQ42DRAFT_65566 [Ramicandelaber brevisporus]
MMRTHTHTLRHTHTHTSLVVAVKLLLLLLLLLLALSIMRSILNEPPKRVTSSVLRNEGTKRYPGQRESEASQKKVVDVVAPGTTNKPKTNKRRSFTWLVHSLVCTIGHTLALCCSTCRVFDEPKIGKVYSC